MVVPLQGSLLCHSKICFGLLIVNCRLMANGFHDAAASQVVVGVCIFTAQDVFEIMFIL